MHTLVKICGITNEVDALACAELGADLLGFVFAESPRRIEVNDAANIISLLPPSIGTVGLFVNEGEIAVKMVAGQLGLSYIQLHGDEDPDYCVRVREGRKVIKAFRVKGEASLKDLPRYDVDIYLLDTYVEASIGGTGATFNWEFAKKAKGHGRSIMLAGGLTPKNVADAIRSVRPFGVDVSTGVEKSPGKKDHKLLKEFISQVRNV